MRKLCLLLLAFLALLGSYLWEGGSLRALFSPVSLLPLIAGSLLTTLAAFEWRDIAAAFQEGFSKAYQQDQVSLYRRGILVVKNLQTATTFWMLAILIAAVIQVLSQLSSPGKIGMGAATACTVLLYNFCIRALLYIPMESNLKRKIYLAGDARES